MSSTKYLQKRVGYLGAVQSFRPDTEVLMLATNLLKKVRSLTQFILLDEVLNRGLGFNVDVHDYYVAPNNNASAHHHKFLGSLCTLRPDATINTLKSGYPKEVNCDFVQTSSRLPRDSETGVAKNKGAVDGRERAPKCDGCNCKCCLRIGLAEAPRFLASCT